MADFYPVLSRAVGALPVNTAETRRAIYERARAALLGQLRSIQPPMSEADLERQSDSLSLSAARIEAEYEAAEKAQAAQAAGQIAQEPHSQEPTHQEQARQEPAHQEQAQQEPASPEFAAEHLAEVQPAPALQAPPIFTPIFAEASSNPSAAAPNWSEPQPKPLEPADEAREAQHVAAPALEAPVVRPRVATPPKPVDVSGRRRTMIVGGGVGLAVLGIAVAAYIVNTAPATPPANGRLPTAPVERNADRGGKLGERVGQDAAPNSPGVRTDIPVAQRAVLYIESPDDPQKPQTIGGRVAWRLDSESVGQGRPVDTVVRATVEIPESGISLIFTIRRNTDAAFPASHILGMRFTRSTDDGNGAVKEAGVPQLKADEGERGAPLSAITSSLGDNLFVSALSNVPIEIERNVDLMTRRNWVDIPVRFASGKRGIIAFEKGFSGDQTITDAFNRWR